jgi:hypothetical protein
MKNYLEERERIRTTKKMTETIKTYSVHYKCKNCNTYFDKVFNVGKAAPDETSCITCNTFNAVKSWTDPFRMPYIPTYPNPINPHTPWKDMNRCPFCEGDIRYTHTCNPWITTTTTNKTSDNLKEQKRRESTYLAKREAFYNEG